MPRRAKSDTSPSSKKGGPAVADSAEPGPAPGWVLRLLAWYAAHRRAMPWRDDPRPYPVWISEIMLQQTQVDTVIPYFERFLATFPTVQALAAAEQQQVLKLWEGLGYYSRARNLHACAKAVVAEHGGELPASFEGLKALPGFGPYTAAAVASIAYGIPVPVVDGNVLRVATRFRGWRDDITKPRTRDRVFAELQQPIAAGGDPSSFNQAVMELGALVCRPVANPACGSCPLQPDCVAAREGLQAELPVRPPRKKTPHHPMAAALIRHGGRYLLARRPTEAMLGGMWEFPSGRREGATAAATAQREALAQTGLAVLPGRELAAVEHAYSHFKITLTAVACRLDGLADDAPPPALKPPSAAGDGPAELVWATLDELAAYPVDKATARLLDILREPSLFAD